MDQEAKEKLARALELVHNAQAHLLDNVSPPDDPKEVEGHFEKAAGLLVDALVALGPLVGPRPATASGVLWQLRLGDRV